MGDRVGRDNRRRMDSLDSTLNRTGALLSTVYVYGGAEGGRAVVSGRTARRMLYD